MLNQQTEDKPEDTIRELLSRFEVAVKRASGIGSSAINLEDKINGGHSVHGTNSPKLEAIRVGVYEELQGHIRELENNLETIDCVITAISNRVG